MFNVDTITLGMNFEDKTQSFTDLFGNIKARPDYKYIQKYEDIKFDISKMTVIDKECEFNET